MRILMIGQKYVPSREGGVEIVVEELSTRLVALGNEVTIFNRKRNDKPKLDNYKGCKLQTIFTINKKSLDAIVYAFFATIKAKRLAKKGLFDVIHYHAEGPCYFLWMFGKKHNGYKLVATVHGLDWQRGKWGGFASKILKKGEARLAKYADEVIVLSKNNQKYFKDTYNRETIYIPNGISSPILHEPEIIKNKFNLELNSYILFLARIVPEKGLDYLIDAWKLISSDEKGDKKLVIAGGDSHSTEYFESIVNKVKNDDSIIMTGFVEGQELEELYSNAYLFVLPSDIEGMPIALLEALSYGNICLVSNIPENTEVINKDSYVFNKGDINDLKDKIVRIIKLNVDTHKETVIPFSWDDVTKKTISVYEGEL